MRQAGQDDIIDRTNIVCVKIWMRPFWICYADNYFLGLLMDEFEGPIMILLILWATRSLSSLLMGSSCWRGGEAPSWLAGRSFGGRSSDFVETDTEIVPQFIIFPRLWAYCTFFEWCDECIHEVSAFPGIMPNLLCGCSSCYHLKS